MKAELKHVVREIYEVFKLRGFTLSVAESCTGGFICHILTLLPGASSFFIAGVVTYAGEMKKKILGVSTQTIARYGVVSEQAAREMAERFRILTNTAFSVSTTGNLGPDVLEGKEKGLVYIAVSREGETFVKELRLQGSREQNKEEAAFEALNLLIEIVQRSL
jgi:nicotinamide-nucleotide amidase